MLEQLHRAWLQKLRTEWQTVNKERFSSLLKPPVLCIDRGEVRFGRWEQLGRVLGISEQHIWNQPWDEVLDTLKHEMAHQYASEVLGAVEEVPHGPAFVQACRLAGVSPRATHAASTQENSEADRMLAKVRKLLALASSPNAHEAEVAMAAANTLLLKYNLELGNAPETRGYGFRRVGRGAAALPVEWKLIASILSSYFFVECIWVSAYNARRNRMERVLELIGAETNLELAAYAHDFLHGACDALWHTASRELGDGGRQRRREFLAGVLMGFSQKLKQERTAHAARGLVWLGDPDLKRYYRERHPRTRSLNGGGVRHGKAHEAGLEAGKSLRIHRGVQEHGKGGGLLGRS